MNVLILSSSRDEINDYYKSISRSISNYLAANDCDLIFGGASTSMMGICYQEFKKFDRKIYAYTTPKYVDDLKKLDCHKKIICETTFDLKKSMFENSDLIICLPGGIGTISELLSYIEEERSNDMNIPIILYDENNYYSNLLTTLDKTILNQFSDKNIYNLFSLATTKEEFEDLFIEKRGKIR